MRLGEILIERRLITEEDLARALEIQRERSGDKIGKILVDLGFIAARDVLAALSEQLKIPVVALDGPPAVSPETESLAPKFLRQFKCLPVALHDHTITLAMADPLDYETRSAVQACTGLNVQVGLAPEQLRARLRKHRQGHVMRLADLHDRMPCSTLYRASDSI